MTAAPRARPTDDAMTAILARGLVDPAYSRALLAGEDSRPASDGTAVAVDGARLALFAGFITKVRYNSDLFEHLPGTLQLLRRHGVELAAFRDYFLAGASRSKRASDKVAAALAHFARFATTPAGRAVTGLADVVAHERAGWELREELAGWRPAAAAAGAPWLRGPHRAVELRHDPWALIEAATTGARPPGGARRPRPRLYWVDVDARELRSAPVEPPVVAVLAAIDGRRDPAAIARHLRGRRISARAVTDILAALAAAGVVGPGAA